MSTIVENIPVELQNYKRWALYDEKKIPYVGVKGSATKAKNNEDSHLALFSEACGALTENTHVIGLSFALREDQNLVVIDLDDPEKTIDSHRRSGKYTEEQLTTLHVQAHNVNSEILIDFRGHYIEKSVSGKGYHIFVKGRLPDKKYRISPCGSIFSSGQFIHMTGNTLPDCAELKDGQHTLDEFFRDKINIANPIIRPVAHVPDKDADGINQLEQTTSFGRSLTLSDDDVIERYCALWPRNNAVYGGTDSGADWSEVSYAFMGDLDKISGDPEQVRRIYLNSPRLLEAGHTSKGVDRYSREERIIESTLKKRRQQTDSAYEANVIITPHQQAQDQENGGWLSASFSKPHAPNSDVPDAAMKDLTGFRSGVPSEKKKPAVSPAPAPAKPNVMKKTVKKAFTIATVAPTHSTSESTVQLAPAPPPTPAPVRRQVTSRDMPADWRDKEVCVTADVEPELDFELDMPPGALGQLAREYQAMMSFPAFKNLPIAAAFATVAAMSQRSYLCGTLGTNVAILTLAPSGAGKEVTSTGPSKFFYQLAGNFDHIQENGMQNQSPGGVTGVPELVGKRPVSSQSLVNSFSTQPRQLLLISEAAGWLKPAKDGKKEYAEMGAALLEIMTKSVAGARLEATGYSDSKNDKGGCIMPSLTLLMETQVTTMNRALQPSDIDTGIVNRIEFIDSTTKSGERGRENKNPLREFSPALIQHFTPLASAIMNKPHVPGVRPTITEVVVSEEAEVLYEAFKIRWIDGLSEKHDRMRYYLFVRAAARIRQYAANLAIADNCFNPIVTTAHMTWSIDFIYRERQALLARFESNEIGSGDNVRMGKLIDLLERYVHGVFIDTRLTIDDLRYVRASFIQQHLRKLSAFFSSNGRDTNQLIYELLRSAEQTGLLTKIAQFTPEHNKFFSNHSGDAYRIDITQVQH